MPCCALCTVPCFCFCTIWRRSAAASSPTSTAASSPAGTALRQPSADWRPLFCLIRPPARPQTLTSFAGRVAPERALLDRERVSQLVTCKVLAWAGMGCIEGSLDRMLAENAAEVSPASRACRWLAWRACKRADVRGRSAVRRCLVAVCCGTPGRWRQTRAADKQMV